ncbi:MAG: heme-binding protein [Pseudohongiellaceae bacterium]
MASAIEKPEYEVISESGQVEFRRYESFIIAETEIVGVEDWNDAANEGFARLFNYITGSNAGSEKIAMTAPVQQRKIRREDLRIDQAKPLPDGEGWKIAFMLPSGYTMTDTPVPEDSRIRLRVVPKKVMAALRYSERWTVRETLTSTSRYYYRHWRRQI